MAVTLAFFDLSRIVELLRVEATQPESGMLIIMERGDGICYNKNME